ncbi:putative transcription factor WRKY family [Helianthus annuus]|nr:putative transcription factor WRKY family [Helianthus annuus]
MKQVKSPEGGSRSYYKCAFSACDAKKIESCDRYNFTVKIVYKGQHKHDPPKRVASKGGELLKRKLISTPPIQVEQIDHLEIKQRLDKNSSSYGNPASALKNPKKPKFIVHADADMEISADGYRWKKYGQKMVKGTPHPRNYYKCTSAGCTVSKHIEKVIDGSSEVTITYKGVHDHNMPVPKKDRAHLPLLLLKIKNIIQYKRREHLPTRVSTNEAARTNESAQTRTLLCVGFEIKLIVENPHLGKL